MDCRDSKKYIYQVLDGEAPGAVKAELTLHVEGCSACRGEFRSIKAFQSILKSDSAKIEPSKHFERVFWQKVLERQKEPWFIRLWNELDSLIPRPSTPQMAMVVLTAFLIGGTGGAVSAVNAPVNLEAKRASVLYLSGFQEFRGIPSSSVAAAYLQTIKSEG